MAKGLASLLALVIGVAANASQPGGRTSEWWASRASTVVTCKRTQTATCMRATNIATKKRRGSSSKWTAPAICTPSQTGATADCSASASMVADLPSVQPLDHPSSGSWSPAHPSALQKPWPFVQSDGTYLSAGGPANDTTCGREVSGTCLRRAPRNNSGWAGWWVCEGATSPTPGRDPWNITGGVFAGFAANVTTADVAAILLTLP